MSEASHDTEQIELTRDELAALGEAAPSEAEQLLLRGDGLDAPEAHADPSVASVARLAELAAPLKFEDLSELELHRGWRGIEERLPGAAAHPAPSTGGGVRSWLFAAVGIAAAAAVLLVVLRPGKDTQQAQAPSPEQVTELAELGEQARAALRVLDDDQTDTERATQLAAAYQRRLAQLEEQDG